MCFRIRPPIEIQAQVEFLKKLFDCDLTTLYPDGIFLPLVQLRPFQHIRSCTYVAKHRMETHSCLMNHKPVACNGSTITEKLNKKCHLKAESARKCFKAQSENAVAAYLKSKQLLPVDSADQNCRNDFSERLECITPHKERVEDCLSGMKSICEQQRIQVTKVLRMSVHAVEAAIKEIKHLHIVYYVRDPRAIWNSRRGMRAPPSGIKTICSQMAEDYEVFIRIRKLYPKHISFLRYEDLVMNASAVTRKLFSRLGEDHFPSEIERHIQNTTHSMDTAANTNTQGYYRADSIQTSTAWRTQIPKSVHAQSVIHCKEILKKLGYTP